MEPAHGAINLAPLEHVRTPVAQCGSALVLSLSLVASASTRLPIHRSAAFEAPTEPLVNCSIQPLGQWLFPATAFMLTASVVVAVVAVVHWCMSKHPQFWSVCSLCVVVLCSFILFLFLELRLSPRLTVCQYLVRLPSCLSVCLFVCSFFFCFVYFQ